MATIPTSVPATLRAGDTITWTISNPDYPASAGWEMAYRLINAVGKIDITSSASGDDHAVSVTAAESAAWVAGKYVLVAAATKGAERYTVSTGSVEILPNLAAQTSGYDTRSTARKLLESVEAALLSRATRTDLEYEIAGRRLKSMTHGELLAARDKLKIEVAAEDKAARIAAGMPAGNRVLVRFG